MFQRSTYQHPDLEPYSKGTWAEVAYAWLAAPAIVASVLLILI